MSTEAINTIFSVESAMETAKAEARAKAAKLLSDTQRELNAMLEQKKEEAAAKTAEVMEAARKKGESVRMDILSKTEQDCSRLAQGAEGNMSAAASMILRRVVES